jgi:hypothetical protein
LFAFASIVNAQVDSNRLPSERNHGSNIRNPTYCINGTLYHKVGSLRSQDGTPVGQRSFSQLYFCDAEDQLLSRTSLGFSHH